MGEEAESSKQTSYESLIIYAGWLVGVLLIGLYITSFFVTLDSSSFSKWVILMLAAPTLPVLFLFTFLIPNLVNVLNKQTISSQPILAALFGSIVVLVSATFLFTSSSSLVSFTIFAVVPALLSAVIIYFFLKIKRPLRILLALVSGGLVSPFIGWGVVANYQLSFQKMPISFQTESAPNPNVFHQSFGFLDIILLLLVITVVGLSLKNFSRKASFFLNLVFVVGVLLYLFTPIHNFFPAPG